jgi:hypothetical protein
MKVVELLICDARQGGYRVILLDEDDDHGHLTECLYQMSELCPDDGRGMTYENTKRVCEYQ